MATSTSCKKTQLRGTFDFSRKPEQNIRSVPGFLKALQGCLRIQRDGLLFNGCPCTSFSWMASSGHSRSELQPFGDLSRAFAREGNEIAARSIILVVVCLVRAVFYFIEQPQGSTMDYFPYVAWLMRLKLPGLPIPTVTRWCPG